MSICHGVRYEGRKGDGVIRIKITAGCLVDSDVRAVKKNEETMQSWRRVTRT